VGISSFHSHSPPYPNYPANYEHFIVIGFDEQYRWIVGKYMIAAIWHLPDPFNHSEITVGHTPNTVLLVD
jgi:hypothetical protein